MSQRAIEEIVEEFTERMELCTAKVCLQNCEHDRKWLRTTLETERRQADERLREVVGEILGLKREFWEDEDHAVGGYISRKDIKAIAAKHNIDITPNTPQV
jgi:hypothetical protein